MATRETVAVGTEFVSKIERIVEINAQVRDLEDEGKALKAAFVDEIGGADVAVEFGNVVFTVDGEPIANVGGRVRENVKISDLRDTVDAVVKAMSLAGLSQTHPQIVAMVEGITSIITESQYAVVTPKR